ncbi:MAG: hypothetical protein AMXMBFR6_11640 [Betaproteobacteria bacterium]
MKHFVPGQGFVMTAIGRARYTLASLGGFGWAGIALCLAAALVGFMLLPPLRDAVASRRLELTRMERAATQHTAPVRSATAELQAFEQGLPTRSALDRDLVRIHELALERGLRIEAGEYKLVQEPGGAQLRYQLLFPTHGTYPSLRAWLAAILNEMPHAALDGLTLRRDQASTETLEARVRISLFARSR